MSKYKKIMQFKRGDKIPTNSKFLHREPIIVGQRDIHHMLPPEDIIEYVDVYEVELDDNDTIETDLKNAVKREDEHFDQLEREREEHEKEIERLEKLASHYSDCFDTKCEELRERDELIKESIEVIKYYARRMDSGGTARRYIEKAKNLVGEK